MRQKYIAPQVEDICLDTLMQNFLQAGVTSTGNPEQVSGQIGD